MNEDEACAILLLHRCNKTINRKKLRNVLKQNHISYHKPGPENHMKTKKEIESIVTKLALSKLDEIINNFNNFNNFNKSVYKSIYI